MLARCLEAAGLSTLLITPMPYWAKKIGAPRTLAVEFPFGNTLGEPGNKAQQLRVLQQGMQVLQAATEAGIVEHSREIWPKPVEQAIQSWQPGEPSPIIKELSPRIRQFVRESRGMQSDQATT